VRSWPLATVLALRRREEDVARTELARALAVESGAQRERAEVACRAAAHATRLGAAARPVAEVVAHGEALRARGRFAERLREEASAIAAALADADRVLADARRAAAGRRAALREARGALRALERHRDGWRAEQARRLDRADEEAVEDAVSARRAEP
jgi:SWI/SNF-related matrix-associated actin-dependent regulator 1 of chromatin subfamily A